MSANEEKKDLVELASEEPVLAGALLLGVVLLELALLRLHGSELGLGPHALRVAALVRLHGLQQQHKSVRRKRKNELLILFQFQSSAFPVKNQMMITFHGITSTDASRALCQKQMALENRALSPPSQP